MITTRSILIALKYSDMHKDNMKAEIFSVFIKVCLLEERQKKRYCHPRGSNTLPLSFGTT